MQNFVGWLQLAVATAAFILQWKTSPHRPSRQRWNTSFHLKIGSFGLECRKDKQATIVVLKIGGIEFTWRTEADS